MRGNSARNSTDVGHLKCARAVPAEGDQFGFIGVLAIAANHQRLGRLAPLLMRYADHRAFEHRRMLIEHILDVRRTDVLAAGDDHILLPIDDVDAAHLVPDREISRVEVAVADRLRGLLGLLPIAFEHDVGTRTNLANGRVVGRNRVVVIVEDDEVNANAGHARA